MANYTSNINITSARFADGYVEAWLVSETDTTATIGWKIGCRQKQAALYGQVGYCYVDGTQRGYCQGYLTSSSPSWKEVCSTSGTTTVSKKSTARKVPVTVKTRVQPVDGYGSVTSAWAEATYYVNVKAVTIYEPSAPSGLVSTRESDTRNTLAWTAPATSTTKPVDAQLVERQVDGGAWSQIASVRGTASSYVDTTTAADHWYAYRVCSQNSAGRSGYAESGYTYNTPAAPVKVTPSRSGEASVLLSIDNAARTATGLDIQRSTDGDQWETVSSVSGSPVTEATDNPGGGTFYYRARNTRGELASEWSPTSEALVTIAPPNAPTLRTPASGVVVSKSQPFVTFEWLHNPVDGSAQTAAEVRYSLDSGSTWQVVAVDGNGASYGLTNAFAVNSTVTWGARTKGVHAEFGPWSGNRAFTVKQEPTVAFAQPSDGFTVENLPVSIQLQYDDPSGELASAALTIYDGTRAVWSKVLSGLTYEIASEEWSPDNEKTYIVTADVRSTSTLTATASRSFNVSFIPPAAAAVTVQNDLETGFASLSVYVEDEPDRAAVESIVVFREVGGERMLLGDNLQPGAGLVDMYAPTNTDYQYVVVSRAESGAVFTNYVPARIDSQWFYFIWGDEVAKGRANPEGSKKLTRPNRRRRHFAGRQSPVSFDDGSVNDTRSVSVLLRTKEQADAFHRMMWESGRCVYKSGDGEVIHADVELSDKPAWQIPTYYGSVSVSLTRIDGRAL